MNTYDVGDNIRCVGTFTQSDGTAIDPSTVTFKHKDPSGNVTTLVYGVDVEVVKSATGIYYIDIDIDESGRWNWRVASTGTGQAAGERAFDVRGSKFG